MYGDWPWALLLLLISPAVGSFLAVLADRLPTGRAVTMPSCCEACKTRLRWLDMVPVLSGLALRGRCRTCGARIPGHLLRVELAAVLAALVVVVMVPGVAQMWLFAATLWCLIALFYADLLHFRLPNALTAALLVLGLAVAATDPVRGWQDGVLSAAVGAAAFWLIRWGYFCWRGREGLGLGDVKLIAGIGGVGWLAGSTFGYVAGGGSCADCGGGGCLGWRSSESDRAAALWQLSCGDGGGIPAFVIIRPLPCGGNFGDLLGDVAFLATIFGNFDKGLRDGNQRPVYLRSACRSSAGGGSCTGGASRRPTG